MLTGLKILIAEDEALVACDLACAVKALDGIVIGPVASVAEALSLLDEGAVDAAIVDANLIDRDVTPLAIRLIKLDVPLVVHTGNGLPDLLRQSHPYLPVVMKPMSSDTVLAALMANIA